jgi:hypothetical protein
LPKVADHVDSGLQNAVLPRFGVLRHEENVADALVANFVDELVEDIAGSGHYVQKML